MTPNEYQKKAFETAVYPGVNGKLLSPEQIDRILSVVGLVYCLIGMLGEAGEVAELIKKFIRDGKLDREALKKELGDVSWYHARTSDEAGFDLEDVMQTNLDKLADRKARNVLRGSGDER